MVEGELAPQTGIFSASGQSALRVRVAGVAVATAARAARRRVEKCIVRVVWGLEVVLVDLGRCWLSLRDGCGVKKEIRGWMRSRKIPIYGLLPFCFRVLSVRRFL